MFALERHPTPVSIEDRTARLVDPVFGRVFTDHMAVMLYNEEQGWHDGRITARAPLTMDPASAVLHYAQEIFEGMKAYRQEDDSIALFRPRANAERFRASARRMAMPELPDELFLASIHELVKTDRDWIPTSAEGSLYLRPFMIASEVFLGVKPAAQYIYMVLASSVGAYWKGGARAVSLWVSHDYTRAGAGGTGAAKCGGNYATSLVAQQEAIRRGYDQVVFLDAAERRWIEELGGMNIFFVFDDGSVLTPELTGTILPGITRASLLALAAEEGLTVREGRYSLDRWKADGASGRLLETFACGTAAVVTPVGKVAGRDGEFVIGSGGPGQLTQKLRQRLVAIQRGEAADTHGWVKRIA